MSRGQALATCFETLSNFCRSSRGYWGDRGQGGVAGSPEPGSVSQAGRSWLPGPRLMLSVTAVALPGCAGVGVRDGWGSGSAPLEVCVDTR